MSFVVTLSLRGETRAEHRCCSSVLNYARGRLSKRAKQGLAIVLGPVRLIDLSLGRAYIKRPKSLALAMRCISPPCFGAAQGSLEQEFAMNRPALIFAAVALLIA